MTPIELLKIIALFVTLGSVLAGIVAKFTTHGNKIKELQSNVTSIKNEVRTLESKIDSLSEKVSALDRDIQIIKVTTENTNSSVLKLLTKHDAELDTIKLYIAKHEDCSNYKVNTNK